jgi:hypothetical protein
MLAIEVWVNGKRLTLAGAADLCVLSAIVSATGKLGESSRGTKHEKDKADISLRVGGLTSRPEGQEDEHLTWVNGRRLGVGDEVKIKLMETKRPRAHSGTSSAGGNIKQTNEKKLFEFARKEYLRLRDKYESTDR